MNPFCYISVASIKPNLEPQNKWQSNAYLKKCMTKSSLSLKNPVGTNSWAVREFLRPSNR